MLLWYTPPYRHCTLIKLLWARVAVSLVFEHDLTMNALLENGLSDIRCCYPSNIYQFTRDDVLISMGRASTNPTQVQMIQYFSIQNLIGIYEGSTCMSSFQPRSFC